MPSPVFSDQIEQLKFFVNRVRLVQASSSKTKDQKIDELKSSYSDLSYLFEKLTKSEIEKNFSKQDAEVIEFLRLGKKNNKVFERLSDLIAAQPEHASVTLAKFIKSREGFDEINATRSPKNEAQLKEIFETLFGVELAAQCVQAFRAEKVGSVIGYALSGLHKDHIEEWQKDKRSVKVKGTLSQYLIDKVRQSDVALEYLKVDADGIYGYYAQVDELGVRHSRVRQSNTADHCFVNAKEKKMVIGSSTSASKDPSQQGQSYFDALEAAKCLVGQEFINGSPNPYYGFSVEPFYFSTGHMVSNVDRQELKDGSKTTIGKVRGRDVINNTLQSDDEALADFAQSGFLAIATNGGHPKAYVSFLLHNLFLAGTDTEDCHNFSKTLAAIPDFGQQSLVARKFLCEKFTSALTVLNTSDLSQEYQTNTKTGREGFVLATENINKMLNGLHQISTQPFTEEEYSQFVAPLLEQANVFFKKYNKRTQTENSGVKEIGKTLEFLNYEDGPAQVLKKLNRLLALTDIPEDPHWVQPPVEQVVEYTTAATPTNLVPLVWLGKELLGRIEGSGLLEKKFKTYLRSLNDVLAGQDIDEVLSTHYPQYDDSRVNLSVHLKEFKERLNATGKEALGDFVGHTQFILSKFFNGGDFGAKMEITAQEACDFFEQSRFNVLRSNIDKAVRQHLEEQNGSDVTVQKKYKSRK